MFAAQKSSTGYLAGGEEFFYPQAGDPKPPLGAKVIILTCGGVAHTGPWSDNGACIGWAPLPKRNKSKEATILFLGVQKAVEERNNVTGWVDKLI